MKADVLITGASGVLGWHLSRYWTARGLSVQGTFASNRPRLDGLEATQLNLEDTAALLQLAQNCRASSVIHTAALTQPDLCEKDPGRTQSVNVEATRLLAENLPPRIQLIYVSTDLVFDGLSGNYGETDPTNPLNLYAKSKLEAEEFVRRRAGAIVVRMAKIYATGSPFHPCFVTWMKDRFDSDQPVPLFLDQFRTPIYAGDMGRALDLLLKGSPRRNLYHLGGAERSSRLEFGRCFAEVFDLDASLISPTAFESLGLVPRGKDCSLDSSRFQTEFGFSPLSLKSGLQRMKSGRY